MQRHAFSHSIDEHRRDHWTIRIQARFLLNDGCHDQGLIRRLVRQIRRMLWPQLGYFFVQQIMRALEYRGFLLAFAVQISVGENQPLDAFRIRRFGNANGLDQIRIGQILRIVLQIGFGKRLLDFTPRHALGNADAPLRDLSLGQAREQFAQCRFAVKLVFTDFVIARTAGQCSQ